MTKAALIIIHYKGVSDTLDCLNSLKKIEKKDISLFAVLIDNSEEGNLKDNIPNFKVLNIHHIRPSENVGFAQGNNLGILEALKNDAEFIILLNNDTLVPSDFLLSLIDFAKNDKKCGLVSPKIYFAPGFEFHHDKYQEKDKGKVIWYAGGKIDWDNITAFHQGVDQIDRGQFDNVRKVDFATGCCLLIKRELIDKIGLFDKNYFLYFEDVDYSFRAKKAGFDIYYYPSTYIWHKNASSSGKPGSPLHVYYQARNRLYFGLKYGSLKVKIHLLIQAFKDLLSANQTKRQASLDYFLRKMGKGSFHEN